MSGEPYSQKSGWINRSNERIFQVITLVFTRLYYLYRVKANIAQSLVGDWERITVADPRGIQGVPRY